MAMVEKSVEHGRAQLISRNGNPFASFADLAQDISAAVPNTRLTVLDGEIVCVDKRGKPQFRDLLFRRAVRPTTVHSWHKLSSPVPMSLWSYGLTMLGRRFPDGVPLTFLLERELESR